MQQFYSRPLSSGQEFEYDNVPEEMDVRLAEMGQERSTGYLSAHNFSADMLTASSGGAQTDAYTNFHGYNEVKTDQLHRVSNGLPMIAPAPTLTEALQATMNAQARMVVIPGSSARRTKRLQQTNALPGRRMKSRLRHGIVISAILAMIIFTLASLSPLDNGQSPLPLVGGINNWVRAQQLDWAIKSHVDQAMQNSPVNQGSNSAGMQNQNVSLPANLTMNQYVQLAEQDATDAGISPTLFVRQIQQESGFNPNAGSPAGAVGIAQFIPSTAASLGIDPYNPAQALRGAAFLMAGYANQYGGDYAKALAAYNAGTGNLQNAVNSCGANWLSCLPLETQNYVRIIMG
jgi:soluble lytic murein transglycosylase-like protein